MRRRRTLVAGFATGCLAVWTVVAAAGAAAQEASATMAVPNRQALPEAVSSSSDSVSRSDRIRCRIRALDVPADAVNIHRYDTDGIDMLEEQRVGTATEDPQWTFLLRTPDGPFRVDARLYHNGQPYRRWRERLIDAALADTALTQNREQTPIDPVVLRLLEFAAEQPQPLTRDECRWLLAAWLNGPPVLTMKPTTTPRHTRMPLWQFGDQNADGQIDANEQSRLPERLRMADRTDKGAVALQDLQRVLAARETAEASSTGNQHGRPRHFRPTVPPATPIAPWQDRPTESIIGTLQLAINWNTSNPQESSITLDSVRLVPADMPHVLVASEDTIVLRTASCQLEMSFVRSSRGNGNETDAQFTVGAAWDGYPLWRQVDTDSDGRLTESEIERLGDLWTELDGNGDGRLDRSELPDPLRLVFGAGHSVHFALDRPVAAPLAGSLTTKGTPTLAPAWFQGMDVNRDGALSRTEFLGTDEQFQELDANGDQRLDVTEVPKR